MKSPEGFLLKAHAFGGGFEFHRRGDRPTADVAEACFAELSFQDAWSTQTEWPRLPWQRRRQVVATAIGGAWSLDYPD